MMLWERFSFASFVAAGEMSTPWRRRRGMWGERRECRRSGMQPVPVQRSRMRSALRGREGTARRRREARCAVIFSVSGLCNCRISPPSLLYPVPPPLCRRREQSINMYRRPTSVSESPFYIISPTPQMAAIRGCIAVASRVRARGTSGAGGAAMWFGSSRWM